MATEGEDKKSSTPKTSTTPKTSSTPNRYKARRKGVPPAVPLKSRDQITSFQINTVKSSNGEAVSGPWNLLDEGSFPQAAFAAGCSDGATLDEEWFEILNRSGGKDDIIRLWKTYFHDGQKFKQLNKTDAINDLVDYFTKKGN